MASAEPIGRYLVFDEIAAGGMATVRMGRLVGPVGFARTLAFKQLHPHLAKDPEFVAMFLDEARLAARVRHPNVVSTVDVVTHDGQVLVVLEYVHGEALSRLCRAAGDEGVPIGVALSVMAGVLHGLHAAHDATGDGGAPLGIVHRDVSPQNIMVGADGIARVVDFGIAKAAWRSQSTRDGHVKGKLGYMAPEQLELDLVDRRTDVYAAGVVLWELLAGRRLFGGENPGFLVRDVLSRHAENPSAFRAAVPTELDEVALRALARDPAGRFATAREMAIALESAGALATPREVGEWVDRVAAESLARQRALVERVERGSSRSGSRDEPAVGADRGPSDNDIPTASASRAAPSSAPRGSSATLVTNLTAITGAGDVATRLRPRAWHFLLASVVAAGAALWLVQANAPTVPSEAAPAPPERSTPSQAATPTVATTALAPSATTSAPASPPSSSTDSPVASAPMAGRRPPPSQRVTNDCADPYINVPYKGGFIRKPKPHCLGK